MAILTKFGRDIAIDYIWNMQAKRKEILDAGKDTAIETQIPTILDIEDDIELQGVDSDNWYCNCWGVTDNYDADNALWLKLGTDFYYTPKKV